MQSAESERPRARPPLPLPRWMHLWLGIALATLGIVAFGARLTDMPAFSDPADAGASAWTDDFLQDYVSARAWRDGTDPYQATVVLRDRYARAAINEGAPPQQMNPHPPFALLLVAPLTFLPYEIARTLWLLLSAGMIAAAIAWFARAHGAGPRASIAFGIGSLALPVVQKDLSFGQNNGLILLLLVAAWVYHRAGAEQRAGVLLGLAIAIKLFPLLLLIPLLRSGSRRTVILASAAAVLLALVATAAVGLDETSRFAFDASPSNFAYWRAGPMNLSVVGLPFRWLTENPWREAAVHLPLLAGLIAVAATLACVVAAAVTRARVTGDPFWAAAPWMILASPLAWDHYLVIALPAVGFAVARVLQHRTAPPVLVVLAAALIVIGTPPGVPTTVPGISDLTQVLAYGLPLYGLVLLGVLDLPASRARRSEAS